MGYSISTSITPHAAAKLLISNEMDVTDNLSHDLVDKVLDELLSLTVEECLSITDFNGFGNVADIKYIPQFGKLETICRVPQYFIDKGQCSVDFAQLGFYLKSDLAASLAANTKYGENHGKMASLLGLTSCVDGRIFPSSFTFAFCSYDANKQNDIILKLLFRIPIIQIILKEAASGKINGYLPMQNLKDSTKIRRGYSVRSIFNALLSYNHNELNNRINNITWEEI